MPKTQLGRWAGGLLALFVVLLIALLNGKSLLGLEPGTPLIIMLGTCTMISGIAAFITGAVSIIKFKDRSPVVILAVVFGSIAILVTIIEAVEAIVSSLAH